MRGQSGALALAAVWTDKPASLGATVPSVGAGSALVYEIVLTAILMFVIVAVATDTRAVGAAAAIAIGGAVGLDALFGGPVTGASMNPARSLGPRARLRRVDRLLALRRRTSDRRDGCGVRLPSDPREALVAHVLFVCLHNAGRSQMSQALFERAAAGLHTASSAGTTPADDLHPDVVGVMGEIGIDLTGRTPQRLTTELAERADVVVTMGCGDECPYIPGKRYLDWQLEDPKGLPPRRSARSATT